MIEGVIVVDPQGRLQLANEAARQMLRLDDLASAGTTSRPSVIRRSRSWWARRFGAGARSAAAVAAARCVAHDHGARAARAGGGAHGAVVVLHDITDLRRADQIRRDFVANVSHELRTPLTAIRGYVEALLEGDATGEKGRAFLGIIARHADRMERLVKDLLRLARLDAGQETLDIIECDTRKLVQGVSPTWSVGRDAPPAHRDRDRARRRKLRGDPAKLHDALSNLVANAITYSPEDTTIRIDAAPR